MCGIVGCFSKKNLENFSFLQEMSKKLINRGPDDYGEYFNKKIGFCFRRLSIIDLSSNSNQPIEDKRFVLVFNGEIYNYKQIKKEILETDKNIHFYSNGDAEVILKSYLLWGKECVKKFEGMFAFAIWDKLKKTIFIARDKFGEKPLFYTISKNYGFVFASEIKCFIGIKGLIKDLRIDDESLSQYLSLNYLLFDKTFLPDVKNLHPGHYIYLEEDFFPNEILDIKEIKYWSLSEIYNSEKNSKDSVDSNIEKFNFLLNKSLKLRSFSNVNNGIYLSGGIDSSIMTMAAKDYSNSFNYSHNLSFSEQSFDESGYAKLVSEKFNFFLKTYLIDSNNTLADDFEKIVDAADQPMSDTAIISNFYLSKFTSKYSKVCISAEGVDELFCGYDTYLADIIKKKLPKFLINNHDFFYKFVDIIYPNSLKKVNSKYKLLKFFENIKYDSCIAHIMWRSIFSEIEKEKILKNYDHNFFLNMISKISNLENNVKNCNMLEKNMYLDFKTWFHGDILPKVDRTSMYHSQEIRLPFLDTELLTFAIKLPLQMKINFFNRKFILKKILSKNFNKDFINRKKSGFNFPIGFFLIKNKKFKELSYYLLKTRKMNNIFSSNFIEKLWLDHQKGTSDNSYKIFNLIFFSQWINNNNINT